MSPSAPILIAPSILLADFGRLAEEARAVTRAGAHLVHVDVMDGHFVPHLTMGPFIVALLRQATHLPLDVHLMVERPEQYIAHLAHGGASIITIHPEVCADPRGVLRQVRAAGVKAGIAVNPDIPLESIDDLLGEMDLLLVMTVQAGTIGQKPGGEAIDKLSRARALVAKLEHPPAIEVDGGLSLANAQDFAAADVFVSGSAIFGWPSQVEGRDKSAMSEDDLAASYARAIDAVRRKLGEARSQQGIGGGGSLQMEGDASAS